MGRPKIEIPKDKLKELVDKGNRKSELAEHFNCSNGTIQNRAREYGIELNKGKRKLQIPEDKLRKLYFEENLNIKEIGELYGCSQDPIRREMKRHNIRPNYNRVCVDRERVHQLYYNEKYSLADLSEKLNVSEETLRNRMDKWNMERRSLAESWKTEKYLKKISKASSGENNGMYGKTLSEKARNKISEANSSQTWKEMYDNDTLKKQKRHIKNLKYWQNKKRPEFSKKYSGENHWCTGKSLSEEHRRKIRKGISEHYKKSGNSYPNHNPKACKVIENYGDKHGYSFQHAENGGEYYVKEIGCWLDGYDEGNNVVVEVYENFHYNAGNLSKKDRFRENLIVKHLDCEFVRIRVDRDGNVENIQQIK